MRQVLLLIIVVLPGPLRRAVYRHLFGWKVGRGVRIGLSYIEARDVTIEEGVHIGHFNNFRKINKLQIGRGTWISNGNHFFGCSNTTHFPSNLSIGSKCYIMSRHFVDVTGTVVIDEGVTLAGRDTQIWSHSLRRNPTGDVLDPAVAHIKAGVYVGSRSTLVVCTIPAGAMVGAGSVVTKSFANEAKRVLIAGNPAVVKKRYDDMAASTEG